MRMSSSSTVDNNSVSQLPQNNVVQFNSSTDRSQLSQVTIKRVPAVNQDNGNDKELGVTQSCSSTEVTLASLKNASNRTNDIQFTSPEDHDTNEDPGALMIGVVFEESDLDTDADNKLQLYSDVDAAVDSDAVLESTSTAVVGLATVKDISLAKVKVKVKRNTKVLREPSRLSLEERIKCIRMCSRYSSYADAQKAWRQTYDTEPPCRKTMSTIDKKFEKTGSVADLTRTGRPKTTRTEAVIARVEEAVSKDPSKSIRTLAKELGINQASVHRIKKEFEDKRNTLKMENRKLRDRLNEALKRVVLLEKRISNNHTGSNTDVTSATILPSAMEPKYETLVITTPDGFAAHEHIEGHGGSNIPTIISLNNSNNQVLRLPSGQETIHIITLPQGSSHHQVLSLDDSSSFQLSIPSTNPSGHVNSIATTNFLTSTSTLSTNQDSVSTSYVSFK